MPVRSYTYRHDRLLTLAEAAVLLGLSREGVRSRLRRGLLAGERRGGVWLIYPPATGQPVTVTDVDRPDQPDRFDRGGFHDRSGHDRPDRARRDRTDRGHLLEEIAYLRAALEREQVAHGETRRLLGNAQAQLMALLPAPREADVERAERAESAPVDAEPRPITPRRRWAFWRRS